MNIYTGAYYLAIAFKKWGVSWEAVGAYNAGFRKTERQNQRRLAYASEVYRIYTWIKSSKGIRVPTTKKHFPKLTVCRTINIVYIVKYRLCRDSGHGRPHTKISYE